MSDSNPPEFESDQQLAVEILPILGKIHTRVSDGLLQTAEEPSIQSLVKSVFDGALHAHDRTRTQDWPELERQLEAIAANTILSLVLLRRRHGDVGSADGSKV
ncbi:MAG: hypothetical protein WA138_15095 [Parvibaculum sp.]